MNFLSFLAKLFPPKTKTVSNANTRAHERLVAHRAKWDNVPLPDNYTRQRRRADTRKAIKAARASAREALRKETPKNIGYPSEAYR